MRSLFSLVLFAAVSFAAPPEIDLGDSITITACKPFKLSPKTDAKTVVYIGDKNLDIMYEGEFANKIDVVLLSNTPGVYTLTAVAINATGEAKKRPLKVIVVKGDSVIPIPTPDPPPEPITKPKQLFVYFVEQTLDAVKIKSQLFAVGQPLRKWQQTGGHKATAFPINTSDPSLVRFARVAEGKKLPYMLIVVMPTPETADVIWQGVTPDDPKKILELLEKYEK